MNNGGVLVGIFVGLLLLSWEVAGILAKGPKIDTISQAYWWTRDYIKRNTGTVGTHAFAIVLFSFMSWLFWHLSLGGSS